MGLILKESFSDKIDFAVWRIEEDEEFYTARLKLSDWEKKYIDSITNQKRRLRWMASRYLLKYLMKTDEFVELLFDVHGKPFIGNFKLNASISHSENFAAVIISSIHEVGIDVEEAQRDIHAIKNKFLSQTEVRQLQPMHYKQQLLIYWSAKEVMYKIYGKRKLEFKDDMFVKPFILNKRGDLSGILMKSGDVMNLHMHYIQENEYTLVVGSDTELKIISGFS